MLPGQPWVWLPARTDGCFLHVPPTGSPPAHLRCLPLAVALPSSLLWLLYWGSLGPSGGCSQGACTAASEDSTVPVPPVGKAGLVGGAGCQPGQGSAPGPGNPAISHILRACRAGSHPHPAPRT